MSSFSQLSLASINKTKLSRELVYGDKALGRSSGESKLVKYLGDLTPSPWVSNLTGGFHATANQRFEEYVMPAMVATSTSPSVMGGASVMISQANGPPHSMQNIVNTVSCVEFSSTFTNLGDTSVRNVRTAIGGATMAMATELSGAFDGVSDGCANYGPLYMRLFALLEAVAHGWALNAIPVVGGGNNPLDGRNLFWNPNAIANHQPWIDRVIGARGSQVNPLSMFRHRNGLNLTAGIANALHLAISPHCGIAQQLRVNGHPGVGGRCTDAITLAVYGTQTLPNGNVNVPTQADVVLAIKYILRCTGDTKGYNLGFEMWAKRVEFAGPETTILPTLLTERFFRQDTATFCRIWALVFRALYLRKSRDDDPINWGPGGDLFDAGDAELGRTVDQMLAMLQGINPAIERADIETNDIWRGVNNAAWLNVNQEIYSRWIWGVGGHRFPLDFERASTTQQWIDLGRDVGVGVAFSWTNLFRLPAGHEAVTNAEGIPCRNVLEGDLVMPADGVYGRHVFAICSGIGGFLKTAGDNAPFQATGTEGVSRIISAANADQLLSRMYFPSVALRCASNQASHLMGNSRMSNSMAMGIVDTGDANFDDVYSSYIAEGRLVDSLELVKTFIDLTKGVLAWENLSQEQSLDNQGLGLFRSAGRDRFIKEVCFHPFIDTLVLGISSTVGGVINAKPTSLADFLNGTRGGLATAPIAEDLTRLDVVALSAWLMEVGGQSMMWQRRLQFYDDDNRLVASTTFNVKRNCVRLSDGFYGLPRIDSVYHWYYSDGLDAIWCGVNSHDCSPPVARTIWTPNGRQRTLFEDGTANVTRNDFGGGSLQLWDGGALHAYVNIRIGGGGAAAYRTSTPSFAPAPFAAVLANGVIDDQTSLAFLPGKYLNCKTPNRSLISGLKVPTRPASGLDVMLNAWKGVGSLAEKLKLFGLSSQGPTVPNSTTGSGHTEPITVTTATNDSVSTMTGNTAINDTGEAN